MLQTNKRMTLAARPSGMPKESDFKLVETPVLQPGPGEILVRLLYVSVDPYMRGRMNDVKSYAPPVQIAKIKGCRVVGIAGSDQKVAWLHDELGFDAAFNYKTTQDYVAKLHELCPNGVDVYFDNVGGAITDAVFRVINVGARIVVCGQIAQYNAEKPETGPRLLAHLVVKQARAEGFLVFQFASRYAEGLKQMAEWL